MSRDDIYQVDSDIIRLSKELGDQIALDVFESRGHSWVRRGLAGLDEAEMRHYRDMLQGRLDRERARRRLFTIGYRGLTAPQLAEALVGEGVRLLIDIRLTADRDHVAAGYSDEAIAGVMNQRGLRCEHLQAAGNPFRPAVMNRGEPFDLDRAMAAYRERITRNGADVAAVKLIRAHGLAALLCACSDPRHCHRSVFAELVAARLGGACEVTHLPRAQQMSLFGGG